MNSAKRLPRTSWIVQLLALLSLAAVSVVVYGQPGAGKKLPLKAVMVLSPEFCATKTKQLCCGAQEIGKSLCTELPSALSGDFASLTVATATAQAGKQADIFLLPRIVNVIGGGGGFTRAAVTIQLEWKVQDKVGRIVWIQTVPGSASTDHPVYNGRKLMRPLTQEAIEAMAALTASLMVGAPELRGFTQGSERVSDPESASAAEPTLATSANGASNAPPAPPVPNAIPNNPNHYTLELVGSDKKWKHNLRSTNYDDISQYFRVQMAAQMKQKGFNADDSSGPLVCQLIVEILTVKTVNNSPLKHMNPLSTSAPGVTVTAAVEVKDGQGNPVYKKQFMGEADVAPYTMEKSSTLMRQALASLARNVSLDQGFNSALTTTSAANVERRR